MNIILNNINKKGIFYILAIFATLVSNAQSNKVDYSIDGQINGVSSGKIYLFIFTSAGGMDSTIVKDGVFHFKGLLAEPTPVFLSLERGYVNRPAFMLFLDKGCHTVTLDKDNLANGKVTGSATAGDFVLLKSMEKPFDDQFRAVLSLARDTSKSAREQFEKVRLSTNKGRKEAQLAFIKSHLSSPVAAWATHRNFIYDPEDAARLAELYNMLSPSLYYTSYATEMKEAIEKSNMLGIGKIAPNFTQNDTLGTPVSLTDFRGKYVLIDFWASWCKPCRADNPNVVKAYQAYTDKGFTILSVSLDQPGKKEAWMKAIHQDGLTWTHVSDLKFWNNEVAKLYGVKAVPGNLLLDPEGKIIAKNLHGQELQNKLEQIIK